MGLPLNDELHSRLYYFGTQVEVCLGDRVYLRRWLRKNLYGTICYIPGISPKNHELEYEGIAKWCVELESGVILATIYLPDRFQPKKKLVFVSRSNEPGIQADTILDHSTENDSNTELE